MSTCTSDKLRNEQPAEPSIERDCLAVDTVEAIGKGTFDLRVKICTSRSKEQVSSTQAKKWLDKLQRLSETCLNVTFRALTTETDEKEMSAMCNDVLKIYDRELDSLTEKVHQFFYGPDWSRELSIAGTENIPSWATGDHNESSNALSNDPVLSKIVEHHRSKQPGLDKLREEWHLASWRLQAASGAWNVSSPKSTQEYAVWFKKYRTAATQLAQSLPDLRDPMTACACASMRDAFCTIVSIYSTLDPRGEMFLPRKADNKPGTDSLPFWELEICKDRWLMDDLKSKAQKVSEAKELTSEILKTSDAFENDKQAAHTASLTCAVTGYARALDDLAKDLRGIESRRKTFIDSVRAGEELATALDLQIRPDLLSKAESARADLRARVDLLPDLYEGASDTVRSLNRLEDLHIESIGEYESVKEEGSTPAQS